MVEGEQALQAGRVFFFVFEGVDEGELLFDEGFVAAGEGFEHRRDLLSQVCLFAGEAQGFGVHRVDGAGEFADLFGGVHVDRCEFDGGDVGAVLDGGDGCGQFVVRGTEHTIAQTPERHGQGARDEQCDRECDREDDGDRDAALDGSGSRLVREAVHGDGDLRDRRFVHRLVERVGRFDLAAQDNGGLAGRIEIGEQCALVRYLSEQFVDFAVVDRGTAQQVDGRFFEVQGIERHGPCGLGRLVEHADRVDLIEHRQL